MKFFLHVFPKSFSWFYVKCRPLRGGSKQSNCQKLSLPILAAETFIFLLFSCPYHFVFLSLCPRLFILFIYLSIYPFIYLLWMPVFFPKEKSPYDVMIDL